MPELKEQIFKDFDISFVAHPVTKQLQVLTNGNAVKQSVKNIILTNFYERPYKPKLGSNIIAQLFENADPFLEYELSKNIRTAIGNYEPRAILDEVIVKSEPDQNGLRVTVVFRLRNNAAPIQVDVFLDRVR